MKPATLKLKENREKFIAAYEANAFCTFDKNQSKRHIEVQGDILMTTFAYQGKAVFSVAVDTGDLHGEVYEEWYMDMNEMEQMHDIWFDQSRTAPEMVLEHEAAY